VRRINLIVVHHTATDRDASVEAIRRFHVEERGWGNIGYHYVVEEDGSVQVGRHESMVGAHAAGQNANSLGVAVVGDNTVPDQKWNDAQREALRDLLGDLLRRYPASRVCGHRDLEGAATLCPGTTVSTS
jgi:N-acetylmuramoyl-L-alanine amidase